MVMAILHIRNGDNEGAIIALQEAFENREGSIVYINVEPLFLPLHSEQRYQNIIKSMGLD